MPTLIRLMAVLGFAVCCCWGVAYAMATFITPAQREIEQVVTLPQNANLTTGRSAADQLTGEASILVRKHAHR